MPKFSILHTSARPHSWVATYRAWMRACANPSDVEYILCADRRWGFTIREGEHRTSDGSTFRVVYNHGRKCMVDGYQAAAAHCTGDVIVLNSDDMQPCPEWDARLSEAWGERNPLTDDFVIQVSSGTGADARDLMVLQILSRGRLTRLGYVLYPGYESMYADDEFSEHARLDKVVLDARHLLFSHTHGEPDAVYAHQNRAASYALGSKLLSFRRSTGFGTGTPAPLPAASPDPEPGTSGKQMVIGLCLPGSSYSGAWLGQFIGLFSQLIGHGYGVMCFTGYSSNVYVTRGVILEVVQRSELTPDYLVWLDDDNILTFEHLSMLLADARQHPEAGIIAGWCWCQPDGYDAPVPKTSCGMVTMGEEPNYADGQFLEACAQTASLVEVEYTGFPALLMRSYLALGIGPQAFSPITHPALRWGAYGEDVSFCIRARQYGAKILIDPRVQVPHLKLRAVQPLMPGAGVVTPSIPAPVEVAA